MYSDNNPPRQDDGLSRQQRRRLERDIRKHIEKDGDHCSVCRAPFTHNSRTYGGVNAMGATALVGECCKSELQCIVATTIYYSTGRGYDFLKGTASTPARAPLPGEIEALQKLVDAADRQISDIQRRAGCSHPITQINIGDSVWKEDDRVWFEQRPDRSHRVRTPYPGEIDDVVDVPEGRELLFIIRQVAPGNRIKAGTLLNQEILPVPDEEAVIHALFDVAADGGDAAQLQTLIERYSEMQGAH